ncbi:MAG: hypothetical protein J6Y03_00715 [Alphaproteobacteria bacterium]|nr:hypothetical protein [Alphaproteobacteria bacterium]
MKQKNLKKILFINILLCFSSFSVQSQMIDLMGSMGVSGTQTINDVKKVNQMNKSVHSMQFINELQMKNVDISTTYFGNYQKMSTQSATIGNVKVIFKPVNNGKNFEAFIPSIQSSLCSSLLSNRIDNVVSYRFVTNGKSKEYTPAQIRSKSGVCDGVTGLALIFK